MNTAEKSRHCGRKKGITLDFPVREGFLEELTVEQRTLWKRVVAIVQSLSRIPTLQNEAKKHEKSERKHFRCGPSRCKGPGVGMTLT